MKNCEPVQVENVIPEKVNVPVQVDEPKLTPKDILNRICKYYSIRIGEVTGPIRIREVVEARMVIMTILKIKCRLSLKNIGKIFGDRDHTTVGRSINVVKDLCDTDEEFKNEFNKLFYSIGNAWIAPRKNRTDVREYDFSKRKYGKTGKRKEVIPAAVIPMRKRPAPVYSNHSPFGIASPVYVGYTQL